MLILSRRIGETLRVGDQVAVTVLGVKGQQVRLAIEAPKDVIVLREELVERDAARSGGTPAAPSRE